MKKLSIIMLLALLTIACKTKQAAEEVTTPRESTQERGDRAQRPGGGGGDGQRPSPERVFEMVDANEDGKITKEEVAGSRMEQMFDKIDTNGDGIVTLEEFKNAPRPERGQRPGGGQRGGGN